MLKGTEFDKEKDNKKLSEQLEYVSDELAYEWVKSGYWSKRVFYAFIKVREANAIDLQHL